MSLEEKNISSMDVAQRVAKFRKNDEMETFIDSLNKDLSNTNEYLASSKGEANINIIILSPPRSGSTLLYQILCSSLDLGYASNLMARFYKVPLVGAFLQRNLIGDRIKNLESFKSVHGVTERIEEPHEFGYFWSQYLNFNNGTHQCTDKQTLLNWNILELEKNLQGISKTFGKPTIYKLPLGVFYIPTLSNLKNTIFILLERDTIQTAKSVLKVRKERLGSIENWWSFRTYHYEDLLKKSPFYQVLCQILEIKKLMNHNENFLPSDRVLKVRYENVIEDPSFIIDEVKKMAFNQFGKVIDSFKSNFKSELNTCLDDFDEWSNTLKQVVIDYPEYEQFVEQ